MKRSALVLVLAFTVFSPLAWPAEITFLVRAPGLPANEPVFVAGNHPAVGSWDPRGLALAPGGSGSWSATVELPDGFRLEYKITRGSWNSEALTDDGRVPPNSLWEVAGDATLESEITLWKDLDFRPAPLDQRITGTARLHRRMFSAGLRPRDVLVWLPAGYGERPGQHYPVLYMHDGRQVFDPTTSTHGVDWGVDETATALIGQGRMRPVIVVAVDNTGARAEEYGDTPLGRSYRDFVVNHLKPFVDRTYRTLPGREHTAVMGASMGGLVSFLLIWEHPDVFSAAGCLSPAFFPPLIERIREEGSPALPIRIYLDNGGRGLEQRLQPGCDAMLPILNAKQNVELMWLHDPEAEHSESAWGHRVWIPLSWFFQP